MNNSEIEGISRELEEAVVQIEERRGIVNQPNRNGQGRKGAEMDEDKRSTDHSEGTAPKMNEFDENALFMKELDDEFNENEFDEDEFDEDEFNENEFNGKGFRSEEFGKEEFDHQEFGSDEFGHDEFDREENGAGAEQNRRQKGSFLGWKKRNSERPHEQIPDRGEDEHSLIRPGDAYLAAFFVPVLVLVIIFIQREIFPFGEESFLRTDMYHQYAPFFAEFRDKITHGGSLHYSWDIGLGVNFTALYAYYLASPFNWLLVLCPKGLVIEFMTYLIVVKSGLAGLSMTYYLRRHYGKKTFGAAFFGIFYALSGYMAAYSWNIMWLDCIILFPLIMLGLERLVKEKRWGLYCICLGMSILSNYYISIMICIFMVIYFAALIILEGRKRFREWLVRLGQFCFASLGAGGLAGCVLVPEVLALQSTASGSSTFPKTFSSYFSMMDMIARHIGNVDVEIGLDHWPNLYCGVAVFLFFLLYLACRKIPVREKAVFCSLLLFFYLSFSVNVLNFLWHGFHYPNSLPCRQSFIYILLMLSLCYHAYLHLEDIPWKHVALAFWGSVIFVLFAEKLVTEADFHFIVFYAAIFFLALYAGLLYLYQKGVNRNILILLALGLVSMEAAVNMTVTSITTTSRTNYIRDNADVEKLVSESIPKTSFYRVEKMTRKTKNDGAWMNFPSVSLFSSVANADLSKLFRQLGCESSTNAYSITGSTPLINSLLSVRYGIYSELADDYPLLTWLGESGDTYLYENAYTLPLGFWLPQAVEQEFQPDSGTPADVQNQLARLLGCSPVLSDAWGETDSQVFRFTPERDGDYYVYIINKNVKSVTVSRGEDSRNFDHVDRGYFVELGWCRAGEEITITAKENEILDARAYRFEEDALREIYELLNANGMAVTSWQDDSLSGTVEFAQPGVLFTSIPFDEGWKITVDGRVTAGQKVMDAFLGVYLTDGPHEITMEYTPPGLNRGLLISAVSVLLIAAVWIAGNYGNHRGSTKAAGRRKREEQEAEEDEESEDELTVYPDNMTEEELDALLEEEVWHRR